MRRGQYKLFAALPAMQAAWHVTPVDPAGKMAYTRAYPRQGLQPIPGPPTHAQGPGSLASRSHLRLGQPRQSLI